jgi:hypothetical protein
VKLLKQKDDTAGGYKETFEVTSKQLRALILLVERREPTHYA